MRAQDYGELCAHAAAGGYDSPEHQASDLRQARESREENESEDDKDNEPIFTPGKPARINPKL